MATTVILDNFEENKRVFIVFTDDEFEIIRVNWNREDQLLAELSKSKFFSNIRMWSHLKPAHWKFLIARNLDNLYKLTTAEQHNENNEIVKSLHFLILGLIKCLEINADSSIELLKIQRLKNNLTNFEYTATVSFGVDYIENDKQKKPKPNLEVVVDNTKDDK